MKTAPMVKAAPVPVFICLIALAGCLQPGKSEMAKEEVIQKAWKAMFGDAKNEDIKSLVVEGYFHGSTVPNRMTVRRPNLFRNEVSSGILVFDGKRAAWVKREPDEKGNPLNPGILEPAHWRHFEVDIALLFPAFFEYPCQYSGRETVEGHETYKIHVDLPLGGKVTYFLDPESFLVKKRLVSWDGGAEAEFWENTITGYEQYDGVLFPEGYSYPGRDGREKGTYRNVRINGNPAAALFEIPDELVP